YPATANLLTPDQATASFATQGAVTTSTLPNWIVSSFSPTIIPKDGTTNQYSFGAFANVGVFLAATGFSVIPGAAYSWQFKFTAPASVGLNAEIQWNLANGTTSTSNGTTVT